MPTAERIRERVERVGEVFPDQYKRLSKCAEVIIDRGTDPVKNAFEKQLDQISRMKSAHEASKTVDKIEHTIFKSKITSPFLGAQKDKVRARFWIMVSIGILFAVAFLVATVPSLMRLH